MKTILSVIFILATALCVVDSAISDPMDVKLNKYGQTDFTNVVRGEKVTSDPMDMANKLKYHGQKDFEGVVQNAKDPDAPWHHDVVGLANMLQQNGELLYNNEKNKIQGKKTQVITNAVVATADQAYGRVGLSEYLRRYQFCSASAPIVYGLLTGLADVKSGVTPMHVKAVMDQTMSPLASPSTPGQLAAQIEDGHVHLISLNRNYYNDGIHWFVVVKKGGKVWLYQSSALNLPDNEIEESLMDYRYFQQVKAGLIRIAQTNGDYDAVMKDKQMGKTLTLDQQTILTRYTDKIDKIKASQDVKEIAGYVRKILWATTSPFSGNWLYRYDLKTYVNNLGVFWDDKLPQPLTPDEYAQDYKDRWGSGFAPPAIRGMPADEFIFKLYNSQYSNHLSALLFGFPVHNFHIRLVFKAPLAQKYK